MLFNSLEFLIFLPTVFLLYWFVFQKNLRVQNLLLLISSYVFYGWWDYRFLSLIFLSTVVDYFMGLKIYNSNDKKAKKSYLWVSILFNLGLLGFFKYFNFFIDSWVDLLGAIGYEQKSTWTLNVILPVGISFYTFQTMSYSLDIYHGKLKPTKDFISFASFVSFFPQLVAGPIERASNLLPQILNNRIFKYNQGVQGLRLILYGMFKKVVIADSLALHVDTIFENYATLNGGVLLLGLIYFSFQIYCDFSGYSDIAIGTSKLFGFELMSNFKFPIFSRDIREFWQKFHISMSSWFRDYLYMNILMRMRNYGIFGLILATFFTYTIIGLWHGANYTFIVYGLIHALYFLPIIIQKKKPYKAKIFSSKSLIVTTIELFQSVKTWVYFSFSLCFFRSDTITDAISYLTNIITRFDTPLSHRMGLLYVFLIIIFDYFIKNDPQLASNFSSQKMNFIFCVSIVLAIMLFASKNTSSFIYFQF
jgi:alginate O-acetyltransferase complex protein AlgI